MQSHCNMCLFGAGLNNKPVLLQLITRTRMANWALKCPIIILITARSFYIYNNILIIIQHP